MRTERRLLNGFLILALIVGCRIGTAGTAGPAVVLPQSPAAEQVVALPNREGSLKFGVLGDFGDGSREQFELAAQMAKLRERFAYELVITVGDNIYGSNNAQSLRRRFEEPYKPLLDAGVKFYASLGNHDDRELQRFYEPFNMDGRFYYSFKAPHQDVRFFALESSYLNVAQIGWIQQELQKSGERWKIPYFHHPLYSSGGRHGSQDEVRDILEPLFIKYNVSVVFAGHDHIYERINPQNGIVYFVTGSGGKLRRGDLETGTGLTARGFSSDQVFVAVEIDGDELFFNAISRAGQIVDSGIILRRQEPSTR
jgi:predicted MPP superfamily phosphohydrolase